MRSSSCDYYASTDSGYVKYENVEMRGKLPNKTIPVYSRCNEILPYQVHPLQISETTQKTPIAPTASVQVPMLQLNCSKAEENLRQAFSLSLFDYPKQLLDQYEVNSVYLSDRLTESGHVKAPSTPQNSHQIRHNEAREVGKKIDLTQSAITNTTTTKVYRKSDGHTLNTPNTDRNSKEFERDDISLDLTVKQYDPRVLKALSSQNRVQNSNQESQQNWYLMKELENQKRQRESLELRYHDLVQLLMGSRQAISKGGPESQEQHPNSRSQKGEKTQVTLSKKNGSKRHLNNNNHKRNLYTEENSYESNLEQNEDSDDCTEPQFGMKCEPNFHTKQTSRSQQQIKVSDRSKTMKRRFIPLPNTEQQQDVETLEITLEPESEQLKQGFQYSNGSSMTGNHRDLQEQIRVLGEGMLDLEQRLNEQQQRHSKQRLEEELKRQQRKVEQMQQENNRLKLINDMNSIRSNQEQHKVDSGSAARSIVEVFSGDGSKHGPLISSFMLTLVIVLLFLNLSRSVVC